MVDLTVTATAVIADGDGQIDTQGVAGAAITAGQVVYKEAATGLLKLADADHATIEARTPYGIALNGAATGQSVSVLKNGTYTVGATVAIGVVYYLSKTAGGIAPVADVTTPARVVPIMQGISATKAVVRILDNGATI